MNGAENMLLMHEKFEIAYDQMRVTIIPMTSNKYQVSMGHFLSSIYSFLKAKQISYFCFTVDICS